MRGMWLDWVRERGWDPVQTCKNRRKFRKKEGWETSPNFYKTQAEADAAGPTTLHDGTQVEAKVAQPVVTWPTFRNLWVREFPNLKVRPRGEDTCTDCYKIWNKMRFLINEKIIAEKKLDACMDNNEASPENQSFSVPSEVQTLFETECAETESEVHGEQIYEGTTPEELASLIEEIEKEIERARNHVRMHEAQREDSQRYTTMSQDDHKNGVALSERTKTVTMDMSQNTHLPWLGGDQCGDLYYMSPWTQYIFGIVDNATHFLDAFIWGEGTANRGADNIVSCLNKYITKYGVVGEEQPTSNQASRGPNLKRLVIIADNCSGQNKNNCVIKYCCWLVEAGWCGEVVLFFLVKGHTKNECDSKFNKLKSGTKGVNIFTEAGLDWAYFKNNEEHIALHRVSADDND